MDLQAMTLRLSMLMLVGLGGNIAALIMRALNV